MIFRRLRKKRVLVNTKDGQALRGVLWSAGIFRSLVMLRDASLLNVNGSALPIDGDVFIERRNVSFYQVIPPAPMTGGS